jgi:ribonuclease-3
MVGKDSLLLVGRARDGILADAVEAVLGAIYLSSGFDAAREVIERFVLPLLENPDELRENADPKTTLQMHCQRGGMLPPTYETSFGGPPHNRIFFAQVFSGLTLLGEGKAHSLKEAKTEAAADAVAKLAGGPQNTSE